MVLKEHFEWRYMQDDIVRCAAVMMRQHKGCQVISCFDGFTIYDESKLANEASYYLEDETVW